jgi:transcription-repair coupling factor (superfamily II helicase)
LKTTDYIKGGPSRTEIAGAPGGAVALLLGEIATGRPVLHIARDDAAMATLAEALAFFHPHLAVLLRF